MPAIFNELSFREDHLTWCGACHHNTAWVCACRFVLLLTKHPDYFFWLYIVYIALQGWLALLALVHYPHGSSLELKYAPDGFEYVVWLPAVVLPAWPCPAMPCLGIQLSCLHCWESHALR